MSKENIVPENEQITSAARNLRGKPEPKRDNPQKMFFILMLMAWSSFNTFNLFMKSFHGLGLFMAALAIGVFDYGYWFWQGQMKNHVSGSNQKKIVSRAKKAAMAGMIAMIALDFLMHSEQTVLPLDLNIIVWGFEALIGQVLGAAAMLIVIAVGALHIWTVSRYEEEDVDTQQSIAERQARHDRKNRLVQMQVADNAIQGEMTAAAIEEMQKQVEAVKPQLVEALTKVTLTRLVGDWSNHLIGGVLPETIEGEARDLEPAPKMQTAMAKASEVDAEPLNPTPRRSKPVTK